MKLKLILTFLIFFQIFSKAQVKMDISSKIPVDKYDRYEVCCVEQFKNIRGLIDPIENELRVYAYENISNALAFTSGKVAKIIKNGDQPETVLLKTDDLIFVYSNLKNIRVRVGEEVSTKQILGQISTLDAETFLGFQVWNYQLETINPIKYLEEN